jgi:protein involved in temperature-dependent protein secretion
VNAERVRLEEDLARALADCSTAHTLNATINTNAIALQQELNSERVQAQQQAADFLRVQGEVQQLQKENAEWQNRLKAAQACVEEAECRESAAEQVAAEQHANAEKSIAAAEVLAEEWKACSCGHDGCACALGSGAALTWLTCLHAIQARNYVCCRWCRNSVPSWTCNFGTITYS